MWLWVAAGVLAVIFLGSGVLKIAKPRAELYESGQTYVEDFPTWFIKLIGVVEVLAALALVLPPVLQWRVELVPLAGLVLGGLMIGGVAVRIRRSEWFIVPLFLGAAAIVFAILRLNVEPLV